MDFKALLVNPSFKYIMMSHVIPIGLFNLGKILKNHGFDIKIIDINAEKQYGHDFLPDPSSPDEFLKKVKKFDPEVIGFTSYSANYPIAMRMAQMCKTENENIKVIFGGIHATFQATECLTANPFIDVIVRGEAEHVIAELARRLAAEQDLSGIHNIVFRENNYIKYSQLNTLPNLSIIPPLDLELIKDKFYPSFLLQVEFSRGCPFQCAFCCISPFTERNVRYFPAERIVDTLEVYQERFKNFSFSLSDPTFLLNHKRVKDFLKEAKNRKIELKQWMFETRVDTVNREILKELKKYDAHTISLGIEDIHNSVLQMIGKQQTFKQIQRAMKIIKEVGLHVESNFILGLPSQTKEQMLDNIEYSKNVDYFGFPCLLPLPGSQIINHPDKYGISILSKDWELYNGREIVTESISFPYQQQREVQDKAYRFLAQFQLENDSIFYFERERHKDILEIGYHSWQEEWKEKQKSNWN
ncbi:MAG: B12-binding domain-containing radical SAM protein [Promethearchaeota archaeon]